MSSPASTKIDREHRELASVRGQKSDVGDLVAFDEPNTKHHRTENAVSDHVYKKIELTGSSSKSIEDAINNAVSTAAKTVRNMRWFEVIETRGHIENQAVAQWQVTIKVGFTIEE